MTNFIKQTTKLNNEHTEQTMLNNKKKYENNYYNPTAITVNLFLEVIGDTKQKRNMYV